MSDRRPDKRIVTEEEVEEALSFLRDSAGDLGEAKRRTVSAGHWIKHVEALEFRLSEEKSADARRADARASERYIEAITEDARAAGEFEKMKALREAAALAVEAWRTESSNFRSMKL